MKTGPKIAFKPQPIPMSSTNKAGKLLTFDVMTMTTKKANNVVGPLRKTPEPLNQITKTKGLPAVKVIGGPPTLFKTEKLKTLKSIPEKTKSVYNIKGPKP